MNLTVGDIISFMTTNETANTVINTTTVEPKYASVTEVLCRVLLEQGIVEQYERRAKELGIASAETLMRHTLQQYSTVDSTKPLVIDDTSRQRLERLLGKNFNDATVLVNAVDHALQVQVGGIPVPLTPHLLDRLHSRCLGMPFDKFIIMTIKRLLEEFVGIR